MYTSRSAAVGDTPKEGSKQEARTRSAKSSSEAPIVIPQATSSLLVGEDRGEEATPRPFFRPAVVLPFIKLQEVSRKDASAPWSPSSMHPCCLTRLSLALRQPGGAPVTPPSEQHHPPGIRSASPSMTSSPVAAPGASGCSASPRHPPEGAEPGSLQPGRPGGSTPASRCPRRT
jgi:hypothetical protein